MTGWAVAELRSHSFVACTRGCFPLSDGIPYSQQRGSVRSEESEATCLHGKSAKRHASLAPAVGRLPVKGTSGWGHCFPTEQTGEPRFDEGFRVWFPGGSRLFSLSNAERGVRVRP